MQKPRRNSRGETFVIEKSTLFMPDTNGVWTPNSFAPTLLQPHRPALDPWDELGVKHAVTSDRNFSKAKWLYNKWTLDPFSLDATKRDVARGKILKRIQRKEDKMRASQASGSKS